MAGEEPIFHRERLVNWAIILSIVVLLVLIYFNPSNWIPGKVMRVLKNAETFEVLSLDPILIENRMEEQDPTIEEFHGYAVRGRVAVADADLQEHLLQDLKDGINVCWNGMMVRCFMPRHGIRATRGKEVVDLVICFECRRIHIYSPESGSVFLNGDVVKSDRFEEVLSAVDLLPLWEEPPVIPPSR